MKAGIPSAVFRATLNYTANHSGNNKYAILIFVGMTRGTASCAPGLTFLLSLCYGY
jgi:hypothetical protein